MWWLATGGLRPSPLKFGCDVLAAAATRASEVSGAAAGDTGSPKSRGGDSHLAPRRVRDSLPAAVGNGDSHECVLEFADVDCLRRCAKGPLKIDALLD